ncbi:MAG: class I SAM-dependent methyltransferase [Bdellovibrionales bacterium]|nr:class I SAM-dependent methyltransferase [Bdellovibrionales bacterium]
MECRICGKPSEWFTKAKVLDSYWVQYFRCFSCGFIFTESPHWLSHAYSHAINTSDLGLVSRNVYIAQILPQIIKTIFNQKGQFLDYGGGYGLLVRMMRDKGFDFFRQDEFCENIFAKGFDVAEAEKENEKFELLTAIEVFEHLPEPKVEVEKMLKYSDSILFTTELMSGAPSPGEWSYYGLEHGQHVALFTRKSLELLAEQFDLQFSTNGKNVHLFHRKKISTPLFKVLCFNRVAKLLSIFVKRPSHLYGDYQKVTGAPLV